MKMEKYHFKHERLKMEEKKMQLPLKIVTK